ncbi:MAG: hypothetical protein K5798_11095, partial [Nitrosopumilus sp.]|uniref:SwmB domain-containing protein n=1 Tax=Nitrosopumilus sp. TaxID=2024843 RepID=UPI00242CE700
MDSYFNQRKTVVCSLILLSITMIPYITQDSFAAVTSVSITEPIASTSFGAGFSIDYTIADDGANTATAGTITFTRTGGTADSGTHVYTMAAGDFTTGAHTISRTTLEADGGFDALVDGAEYTIDISITETGGPFTDQELVVTADFTTPTFTAVKTASNQITITWSENIISTANSATANNPFVLGGTTLTVLSTSDISTATSTQILTLSGNIADGDVITVSYDTDASNGDLLDTANTDPNAVPDINTVSLSGISAASN